MANPEHIEWLLEGVESWNQRRNDYLPRGFRFTPDFEGADLHSAFRDANKLDQYGKIPLTGVDLSEAVLTKASLDSADLTNASLNFADLTDTTLLGSNLTNASLHFADLTRANLTAAELWKADLYPPIGMSPKQNPDKTEPIKAIVDLLPIIQTIANYYSATTKLYFRGESECGWELRPSLMRNAMEDWSESNEIVLYEDDMLVNLMSRRPDEFTGMTSALAQWMLAQHHGLKTRFLDITKNPLVALFHACEKTKPGAPEKGNGRLHVFAVPSTLVKSFNSDAISIIANVAKLPRHQQDALLGKRCGLFGYQVRRANEQPAAMSALCQLIRQEKPYFEERINPRNLYQVFVAEPQLSSERIRAQSGAFLVSAFHERFERDEVLKVNKGIPVYAHYKLTISGDRKDTILKQLELLNVTRETLFPGLDSSAESVTASYRARANG